MFHFGVNSMLAVTNKAMALTLWQKTLARHGTSTKLKTAKETGIILDGDVPGAYSTKCTFQYIIKKAIPYVFKYPTYPDDASVRLEVIKDIDIASALRRGPEFSTSNLVEYSK